MFSRKALTRLMGAAAIAGAAAYAAPASAQSARYCAGDVLVANSFYSNVVSNGKTADVVYYGQFQNMDPQKRALTALMVKITKIGNFSLLRVIDHFDLAPYQQITVNLLSVHTANPGGTGAPSPADVGSTIKFVCTFKPA